jgi:hypothetical protein
MSLELKSVATEPEPMWAHSQWQMASAMQSLRRWTGNWAVWSLGRESYWNLLAFADKANASNDVKMWHCYHAV